MPAIIDDPTSTMRVDRFGFLVRGWVWLSERQSQIAAVEALVNEQVVGSTDALALRQDVNRALQLDLHVRTGFELIAYAGVAGRGSALPLRVRVRFKDGSISGTVGEREVLTFGAEESETRTAREGDRLAEEPPPEAVPPEFLQVRQVGSVWGHHYYREGRIILGQIADFAAAAGLPLCAAGSVLDFGCGCGRVLRGLRELTGANAIWGCDVDADAIRWNQVNLGHLASFAITSPMPPSPFGTGQFDFVYAISVFTHLPEEVQFAWLAELRRIIRPGGLLLASLHGGHYWAGSAPDVRTELVTRGFAYRTGSPTEGLPDYYMVAFHSERYIREKWGRFFDLVGLREKYIHGVHDAVVMRRPEH